MGNFIHVFCRLWKRIAVRLRMLMLVVEPAIQSSPFLLVLIVAESQVVVDAGELCKFLFDEVAADVLEWTKNEHASYNADPLERAEIERRRKPYADQLPEYRYLCDKLFQQPEQ